ncbi:MAG: primosomal replication protein PriC [Vibrionaceae bacterium]
MDLNELAQRLQHFAKKAQQIDLQRGVQLAPLFSQENFHCRARTLTPYVHETQNLVKQLATHSQFHHSVASTEHLCQRLFNQINLLQRVLLAPSMLNAPAKPPRKRACTKSLREEIIQHQKWEHELLAVIDGASQQLKVCQPEMQQQWLLYIATTRGRLERCQNARKELEVKMAVFLRKQREKNDNK